MSGRAGRRGIDDKGLVIVMLGERVETKVIKKIFQVNILDIRYNRFFAFLDYYFVLKFFREIGWLIYKKLWPIVVLLD